MVVSSVTDRTSGRWLAVTLIGLTLATLVGFPWNAPGWAAPAPAAAEKDAAARFNAGDYAAVLALYRSFPADAALSKNFLRLTFQSAVRLGQTGEALLLYHRLHPTSTSHDAALLRPLALSFITSRVHDPQEHLRIAAYQRIDAAIPGFFIEVDAVGFKRAILFTALAVPVVAPFAFFLSAARAAAAAASGVSNRRRAMLPFFCCCRPR